MAQKPSIPKGTRDFLPVESARRSYIFDTIRSVYKLFGYKEIETPAMENLSTLTGKYGEEGDRLLFRILNSGDFFRSFERSDLATISPATFASKACERGLRYDLTVPFARFVVQHKNELTFPFRRFQIQPVWRADRPQKGRYREFYQCDADVIGSDSLLNEVELIQMMDMVFRRLAARVRIHINNRKILTGIGNMIGATDRVTELTVAIDKIDKIGWEGVAAELLSRDFSQEQVERVRPIVQLRAENNSALLDRLAELLMGDEAGEKGIAELREVIERLSLLSLSNEVCVDVSLARGLDYYTGTIFEAKAIDTEMGSIAGGGRYDNLTGVFGEEGMSGVGVSFGADRIFDVLATLDLFPKDVAGDTRLLFVNFGKEEETYILPILSKLREAGIPAEIYPEVAKLKKQMGYADKLGIAYVAFVGAEEIAQGVVTVKDMENGIQQTVAIDAIVDFFK